MNTMEGLGEVIAMRTTAVEFANIARALQHECARLGLRTPAFRTPPHSTASRSIRFCPDGVVVCVRLDRDPHSVTGDLIDGCVAANPDLEGPVIEQIRACLWEAAGLAVAA